MAASAVAAKALIAFALFLGVRQAFHGDAAYFSVNWLMPVMKLAQAQFQVLLGYKVHIMLIAEALACFLCVAVWFRFIWPKINFSRSAPTGTGTSPPRAALTRSLIVLFIVCPAVYLAATHARNTVMGADPFKPALMLAGAAAKGSGAKQAGAAGERPPPSGYLSAGVETGVVVDVGGELAVVEDVSEEEYQSSKAAASTTAKPPASAPSTPPPPPAKNRAAAAKTSGKDVVFASDFAKGLDVHTYSVMKDLGGTAFLCICGFGILFSFLSSLLLDKLLG